MNDNAVHRLFENVEPVIFNSKAKLVQEIQKLCNSGIVFFHIPRGRCLMRPEIQILSDCTIFIKHISSTGLVSCYQFMYEEVKYESLCFNKGS